MANQSDIDNSAQLIADLVDKARTELVNDLYKLGLNTGDATAFAQSLLDLDVEGTLKKKLQKATSVYANAHRQVLESTIGFAEIEAATLTTFAQLNEQIFDNSIIRTISGNIKTEVSKGILAGLTANEILLNVSSSSISNAQMQTLVNTTLNSYSRTITNQMMNVAPANTKYVYIGPVDEKTRPECLEMASADRLTESQIKSRFGASVLIDGGGFNCRHKWEIASSEGVELFEGDKVNA